MMALSDEAKTLARKVGEAVRGTAEEVDRIAKAVEDVMAHVLSITEPRSRTTEEAWQVAGSKVKGSTSSASVSDPPKTSVVESPPATGPSPEATPTEVTQPANGETTTRLSD